MTFIVLGTNLYGSITALAQKYKSKRILKYLMRKNEMEIKEETVFYKRKSEMRGRKESDKIETNFFFFLK